MRSIRQLWRRPLKTILGIAFLALACAFLCVAVEEYFSAGNSQEQIESNYYTMAFMTGEYIPDGSPNTAEWQRQFKKVQYYLGTLPEKYPDVIETVYKHGRANVFCPELTPLNLMNLGPKLCDVSFAPWTKMALVFTLESDLDPDNEVSTQLTGTIVEALAVPDVITDPVGRRLLVSIAREDLIGDLVEGERYLVFLDSYRDLDWELRSRMSGKVWGYDLELYASIDFSKLREPTAEELERNPNFIAYYDYEDGTHDSFSAYDVSQINEIFGTVWVHNGYPGIVQLTGTLEEFLETTDDDSWANVQRYVTVNQNAFPVLTVDDIGTVAQFALGQARISEGRGFTEEEQESGASVCIISKTLALANGLSVGDTLPFRFYDVDEGSDLNVSATFSISNPVPKFYTDYQSDDTFKTDDVSFTIVGLYSQDNEWSNSSYAFTPNTIFIPDKTPETLGFEVDRPGKGVFRSMMLYNGKTEEMDAILEADGYPGLLAYVDQGYSEVKVSLNDYFNAAMVVVRLSAAVWIALALLYLLLFPLRQRRDLRRMRDMGATPMRCMGHMLMSGIGVLVPGVLIGAALAYTLFDRLSALMADWAGADITVSASAGVMGVAVALEFAVLLLLTALVSLILVLKSRHAAVGRRK